MFCRAAVFSCQVWAIWNFLVGARIMQVVFFFVTASIPPFFSAGNTHFSSFQKIAPTLHILGNVKGLFPSAFLQILPQSVFCIFYHLCKIMFTTYIISFCFLSAHSITSRKIKVPAAPVSAHTGLHTVSQTAG